MSKSSEVLAVHYCNVGKATYGIPIKKDSGIKNNNNYGEWKYFLLAALFLSRKTIIKGYPQPLKYDIIKPSKPLVVIA